jgi:hypothetical protein
LVQQLSKSHSSCHFENRHGNDFIIKIVFFPTKNLII